MEPSYRNKNRGYQQLRVWVDAIELYVCTSRIFRNFPFELKKVASQAIASADSVHRNVAEGYCRRSLREYLYHLNIALGSLGESVSGYVAYRRANQITETDFEALNALCFKLENGLLRLVESLERKQETGDWIEHLVIKESNVAYGESAATHNLVMRSQQQSEIQLLRDPSTPSLQYSNTPILHHPTAS